MKVDYDRVALNTGIVHLGVGAFHRAHQAVYTDRAIRQFGGDWGICGVSLRSGAVRDALARHQNVYSVAERSSTGTKVEPVGALTRVLVAPEDPHAVIEAIADPTVHVVTLTITEKGYCLAPASGQLELSHPDVAHDLAEPGSPRSAIGFLVAGLAERRRRETAGLTLISCDNLTGNGDKLRDAVLDLSGVQDAELAAWIEQQCQFPNSMVDRIVPATTESDLDEIEAALGQRDPAAVVTEPFSQWMIERRFAGPMPPWDKVGVEYVEEVAPFEQMKLRLLNASHSSMAYLGSLAGYETVAEVIADPAFSALITQLMCQEMAPTLSGMTAFDLTAYQHSLIDRFGNRGLPHRTRQIAMDGSQKVAQRLLPAITERLADGQPAEAAICSLAGWIRYSTGVDEEGVAYRVEDPLSDAFAERYRASRGDLERYLDSLLQMTAVFPSTLRASRTLRSELLTWLRTFQQRGVLRTVHSRWGVG